MQLKSQEHYDLIAYFDRTNKGSRLDKEPKDLWTRGIIYQDGQVNEKFIQFRNGYALAKSIYQANAA